MKHIKQSVITQLIQGETRAFTDVYNFYYLTLFTFVNRLVRNHQEAQDITAETFVKVWRLHANFLTPAKLKAFIFVTARNACYDYLKANTRKNIQQKEILYQVLSEIHNAMDQVEIKADVLEHIYSEIEKLPQQCKAVFTLFYIEGRKNNEIAILLKITNKTVRNQKALAKKLLRIALFDYQCMGSGGLL